jgi:hypothetical protein
MKLNLDSLRAEVESHLRKEGFLIFYGFSRHSHEWGVPLVEWDTVQYPDYRAFLDIARGLGVQVVVLHHRQFSADLIDDALESLNEVNYDLDDRREMERRLREMNVYDGFTCALELSFDHGDNTYLFDLQADWYRELTELLDQLALTEDEEEDEQDDDPLGGYYSKN